MGTKTISEDDLLTTAQAAKLRGWPVRTVRAYAAQGLLPARQLGRDWLFRRADVLAFERPKMGRPPG